MKRKLKRLIVSDVKYIDPDVEMYKDTKLNIYLICPSNIHNGIYGNLCRTGVMVEDLFFSVK